MDRIYLDSSNMVAVLDHEKKRTFVIRKEGLPDVGKCPLLATTNKTLNSKSKYHGIIETT